MALNQAIPFNNSYQNGLLYALITDVEFLKNVNDDLLPALLDAGESHVKLLKLIKNSYKQAKRALTVELIKNNMLNMRKANLLTDGDVVGMTGILDSGKSLTETDFIYIKERCYDFLKKQTMAVAFSKSIAAYEKADYDTVYQIMGEAYKKNFGKEYNIGIDYTQSSVIDRYLEPARKGLWQTGFPTLDSYLGGGLAKKECITIISATGTGKCLGINTEVLMSDGTTKFVQNVNVGDKLMGPDGKCRNVLSTTKGYSKLYRITPVKGTPYIVNDVHLLSLKLTNRTGNLNLPFGGKIIAGTTDPIFITADELYKSGNTVKHCLKGWYPEAVSFDSEATDLPIPPYILGVWLGAGASAKPSITQIPNEVSTAFKEYAKSIGYSVKETLSKSKASEFYLSDGKKGTPNQFIDNLRLLDVFKNKHIPNKYIMTTKEARLELLAGLIDTDGSLSSNGYDFIQKNEQLAKDVVFIAKSLGLSAKFTKCKKGIKVANFIGDYWRVSISGNCSIIPVKLPYKKAAIRQQKKNVLVTGITITPENYGDYYGFEIDGDKQFLLGDWQVTHNTAFLSNLAVAAAKQKRKTVFVTLEMSELQIAQRFDSIISGFCSKDLLNISDAKVALQRKIDSLFAGNISNLLSVKGFDRGTLSISGLETYLEKYCNECGEPDVVVADWLGAFKLPTGNDKKYEALAEVGDGLVNMSRRFSCTMLTSHQSNRQAVGNDVFSYNSVSESFASLFGFDAVIGLGSSAKAMDAGKRTLTIQKNRFGPDSVNVKLQGDKPTDPLTFKFVEAVPEEDEEELLTQEDKPKNYRKSK